MKKIIWLTLWSWLFICASASARAATLDDAAAIIHKAWQLYRQHSETEVEQISLEVVRNGEAPRQKTLTRWTRYAATGEQVVVKFDSPSVDKGLGLFISRNSGQQQMWLKMPSWSKARRINGNRWRQYFAGTDLTFEDNAELSGEDTENYTYSLQSADAQGWRVTAQPLAGSHSAYSRRDIWVDTNYAISRIDYYNRGGMLIKSLRNLQLKLFSDGAWRPGRIEVVNIHKKRKTVFEISSRQFGPTLSARTFSEDFLRD
ncbi:outer membrane lipoprotein-sorting protein [Vibrio sp. CAU 1672]|uniref:outer membrane lipoprotein-sorting protein n=1 Tax=Vibrio sp. CAU 1672 TaxID=3032594 RepID=UPI0023DA8239|nr:outer membrane lipoprotein-sorting protein [Vibrio sp. CAU 1672]MDF2152808.1 outer membrane lipoprotein-sorting protein [Vibrio sp. CAU 1672]